MPWPASCDVGGGEGVCGGVAVQVDECLNGVRVVRRGGGRWLAAPPSGAELVLQRKVRRLARGALGGISRRRRLWNEVQDRVGIVEGIVADEVVVVDVAVLAEHRADEAEPHIGEGAIVDGGGDGGGAAAKLGQSVWLVARHRAVIDVGGGEGGKVEGEAAALAAGVCRKQGVTIHNTQ